MFDSIPQINIVKIAFRSAIFSMFAVWYQKGIESPLYKYLDALYTLILDVGNLGSRPQVWEPLN